jgi:SAM-dependent methyltransferase
MHRKIIKTPHRFWIFLAALWKKRFGVLPLRTSIPDLTEWFESPLGTALLKDEQDIIDESLDCVFGYELLQLGMSSRIDLTQQSLISHRFIMHPFSDSQNKASALADFNHLPLATETLDAVVLHHVLDFSQSPHHLLREATRLLIPRGHLIIVGFNPYSLFGMLARVARVFSRRPLWRFQYLRLGRLLDWMKLVEMEPIRIERGFFRLPLSHAKAIQHLDWMEPWSKKLSLPWGSFYVIVARKDHIPLIPIKPAWKKYRPIRGLATTRIMTGNSREKR